MLRCSKAAYAKCPQRAMCGPRAEATYYEDSECDKFNTRILGLPSPTIKSSAEVIFDTFFEEEEPC